MENQVSYEGNAPHTISAYSDRYGNIVCACCAHVGDHDMTEQDGAIRDFATFGLTLTGLTLRELEQIASVVDLTRTDISAKLGS